MGYPSLYVVFFVLQSISGILYVNKGGCEKKNCIHQTSALANLLLCFVLFVRVPASIPKYGPQEGSMRSRPAGQMGVPHLLRRWLILLHIPSSWVKI